MKLPTVNKELAKSAIINYIREQLNIDIDQNISDSQLDQIVLSNRKDMDWEQISSKYLNKTYTKIQLFHYYFESFQRSLYPEFTLEDMFTLEDQIVHRIMNKLPLDTQEQKSIKALLSQEYHRTTFNLMFHNTKRRLSREIEKGTYTPYVFFINQHQQKQIQQSKQIQKSIEEKEKEEKYISQQKSTTQIENFTYSPSKDFDIELTDNEDSLLPFFSQDHSQWYSFD